jgi:hypothetical protein
VIVILIYRRHKPVYPMMKSSSWMLGCPDALSRDKLKSAHHNNHNVIDLLQEAAPEEEDVQRTIQNSSHAIRLRVSSRCRYSEGE